MRLCNPTQMKLLSAVLLSLFLQCGPPVTLAQPENSLVIRQATFTSNSEGEEIEIDGTPTPVPPALRAEMERVNEARRKDPGNPYAGLDQPGMLYAIGFDAPETEAIRVLLSSIERYREDLKENDFEKLEDARVHAFRRNYVTNEVRDSCRSLLAMNGNYESKEDTAREIADFLAATDQAEAENLITAFYNLLPVVSPHAHDFLVAEKTKIHGRISSTTSDWYYMAEHKPDFMIERRVSFCSKI